jgi:hypothetical protein
MKKIVARTSNAADRIIFMGGETIKDAISIVSGKDLYPPKIAYYSLMKQCANLSILDTDTFMSVPNTYTFDVYVISDNIKFENCAGIVFKREMMHLLRDVGDTTKYCTIDCMGFTPVISYIPRTKGPTRNNEIFINLIPNVNIKTRVPMIMRCREPELENGIYKGPKRGLKEAEENVNTVVEEE